MPQRLSADERRAYAAMAEAAQVVGRDHEDFCDCSKCDLAFEVFAECLGAINEPQ